MATSKNEASNLGAVPGNDSCKAVCDKPGDELGIVQEEFRPDNGTPKMKWSSLADELYRVYHWANGSEIILNNPSKLNVSKSGGHRVYTMDGVSHYIPSGWNHLYWKVREGCPHFAF